MWEINSESNFPTSWSNFGGGDMLELSGDSSLNEVTSGLRNSSLASELSWWSMRGKALKKVSKQEMDS
jgi:hypothetical protein